MTHRKFVLAILVLLPLGLGVASAAVAGGPQTADLQSAFTVAESGQNSSKDAEIQDGTQNESGAETNDGAQDEGNVEMNDGPQDEGNVEAGNEEPDKESEHENEGEETGEN